MANIDTSNVPPLALRINNTKPVELGDLTLSLNALAEEFRRYIASAEPEASASDVTLYIKGIRTGSIEADLIAASPQIMQGISYVNAVGGFVKFLKVAYDFLLGKSDDKPELDKTSYQNLSNILEPIAKDHGAQYNVSAPGGNVYLTVNHIEAEAAQNAARREIENLGEPISQTHENVLLYWYQARDDAMSKTGDKGIIESISPRPVRVRFPNDRIKAEMLHGAENPFRQAYLVDVIVQTISGKPTIYLVTNMRDRFARDDDLIG